MESEEAAKRRQRPAFQRADQTSSGHSLGFLDVHRHVDARRATRLKTHSLRAGRRTRVAKYLLGTHPSSGPGQALLLRRAMVILRDAGPPESGQARNDET